MVDSRYAKRRDRLFAQARELIKRDPKNYGIAGKSLERLFPPAYIEELNLYPAEPTLQMVVRDQIDIARRAATNGDPRPGHIEMDFRSSARPPERQAAARLVVLAIELAADPEARQVVSEEMCSFASLPFDFEEADNGPEDFGNCICISWFEDDWKFSQQPSPRVLDVLEEAMGVAQHGCSIAKPEVPHTECDGRPCDEPGLNPCDELHRALWDLLRHVDVFNGNATQWLDTHQYDFGKKRQEQRDWILDYTRQWWGTWEPAVKRVRDALAVVQRPELKEFNTATIRALATLHAIFSGPSTILSHEMPGDHLLLRPLSILGFRREDERYLVSNYPRERVGEAVKPILEHIEAIGLFLDEDSVEPDQVTTDQVTQIKPALDKANRQKPMKYEDATRIALAIVRAEAWPRWNGKPSINRLASRVGCSSHTLSKAVENSKELRHLKERDEVALPTENAELAALICEQQRDDQSSRVL